VAEALAVLTTKPEMQAAVRVPLLCEWFENATDALYASICHHGEPVGDDKIRPHLPVVNQLVGRTRYGHIPVVEITKLSDFLIAKFPGAHERQQKLKFTLAAQHLFAGVLMAADWMGSGFAFEPGEPDNLAAEVLRRTA